ncbi:hypothetical protein ACS0TY_021480 [Phlomoides rotata]
MWIKTLVACLIIWLAVAPQIYKYGRKQGEESPLPIVYNSTVSKNNPSAHQTITDALAAAPALSTAKYYIHVEAGVYVERIEIGKNLTNIVFIGDGAPTTKVQWNRHAPNYTTSQTGTITVLGDGFIAMFLTFENTAGEGFQAAAAVTRANHVAYYKCSFIGYQDTIYATTGVQFYRECDIYGTVDFICGDAPIVFQSCNLYANRPRRIITFTAQKKGTPSPLEPSGFVIQNCTLTVAPDFHSQKANFNAFLGRPWSIYSTVVVMESYLDSIIQPAGWRDWHGSTVTDKLVYREFNNRGPGAPTDKRINWTGYEDVTDNPEKVKRFTVGEFINKDGWLDGTNVPYSSGFISDLKLLAQW